MCVEEHEPAKDDEGARGEVAKLECICHTCRLRQVRTRRATMRWCLMRRRSVRICLERSRPSFIRRPPSRSRKR